jgi:hypothetical protein
MLAVQAIYDGNAFIPEKPCEIIKGSKVTLTIKTIDSGCKQQKKLDAFRQLTKEIIESNKTDPLPVEFDEILFQRVHIREVSGL